MGQVEACLGLFGESDNVSIRQVHGLRRMYHVHENLFGRTKWNS
jgi:hypothetical protein